MTVQSAALTEETLLRERTAAFPSRISRFENGVASITSAGWFAPMRIFTFIFIFPVFIFRHLVLTMGARCRIDILV